MGYYIDTHTHLFAEEFDNDRDIVINNSINKNIRKFIIPNIDSTSAESMLNITKQYPGVCFPAIGLHPSSVKNDYHEELEIIEKYLKEYKFCSIGEVGMDLYWDKTYKDEQVEAFIEQINLAEKYDLPLIIHSRKSLDEIIKILEHHSGKNIKGVFHCYPGTYEQAMKVIEMGFVLGIGGVVTYKNAGLAEVVKKIDVSSIILETDSPYLSPVPLRGTRNDSSNIVLIAQKIAEIKNITIDEVAESTTNTAINIFKI
jgi:TatD DNase family protein